MAESLLKEPEHEHILTVQGRLEPVYTNPEAGMTITGQQQGLVLDLEAKSIRPLLQFAEELASSPFSELEKIRKVIQKTNEVLCYPYPDVLAEIKEQKLKKWVASLKDYRTGVPLELSKVIRNGYGICSEFAVVAWILSSHAGMRTSLMNGDVINQKIFKDPSIGLGESVGHVWCEYFNPELQRWFPFDPLTQFGPDSLDKFNSSYQPRIPPLPKNVRVRTKFPESRPVVRAEIKGQKPYPRPEKVQIQISTSLKNEIIVENPPLRFETKDQIRQSGERRFWFFVPDSLST